MLYTCVTTSLNLLFFTFSLQRPYKCMYKGCTKRYTDPSSLRKHAKNHNHDHLTPAKMRKLNYTKPGDIISSVRNVNSSVPVDPDFTAFSCGEPNLLMESYELQTVTHDHMLEYIPYDTIHSSASISRNLQDVPDLSLGFGYEDGDVTGFGFWTPGSATVPYPVVKWCAPSLNILCVEGEVWSVTFPTGCDRTWGVHPVDYILCVLVKGSSLVSCVRVCIFIVCHTRYIIYCCVFTIGNFIFNK